MICIRNTFQGDPVPGVSSSLFISRTIRSIGPASLRGISNFSAFTAAGSRIERERPGEIAKNRYSRYFDARRDFRTDVPALNTGRTIEPSQIATRQEVTPVNEREQFFARHSVLRLERNLELPRCENENRDGTKARVPRWASSSISLHNPSRHPRADGFDILQAGGSISSIKLGNYTNPYHVTRAGISASPFILPPDPPLLGLPPAARARWGINLCETTFRQPGPTVNRDRGPTLRPEILAARYPQRQVPGSAKSTEDLAEVEVDIG
ncbi:hypothetical protein KM043_008288 [Ampulex compressa]|nr:hypothetical protein KM043_008288 [Ampulex compressa]